MLEIKEVNEFLEGKYVKIKQQFWDANDKSFSSNPQAIVDAMLPQIVSLFGKIGQVLEQRNCSVGEITISLIRQSVWDDKKRAVVEVFDSYEVNKKRIYTDEMDITWLFCNWDSFKESLEKEINEQGLSNIIKEPYVVWMMEKTLRDMALVLVSSIRPILLDADEIENFDKLKYIEGFHITVGEYMDWQNIVFAIPPMLEIEDEENTLLMYQRVENMNYRGITFSEKDLSGAKFINCGFQRCVFQKTDLKDARFVNCSFRDVIMKDGSLENAGFMECSLVDFDVSTMNLDGTYERNCTMENVKFD